MSAFERTLKWRLVSYRIVSSRRVRRCELSRQQFEHVQGNCPIHTADATRRESRQHSFVESCRANVADLIHTVHST